MTCAFKDCNAVLLVKLVVIVASLCHLLACLSHSEKQTTRMCSVEEGKLLINCCLLGQVLKLSEMSGNKLKRYPTNEHLSLKVSYTCVP